MGKIIAIGGGEIGKNETLKIDKEIIKLSESVNPKILFIPTASSDAPGYVSTFNKYFTKLKCTVDSLLLYNNKLSKKEIKQKILSSDIIYVGGGNTLKMMRVWKKTGVDKLLLKAYKKGIVLSGLSAGSICWFKSGNSDSLRFNNPKAPLIKVKGLNLIKALHCPHYNTEKDRKMDLKNMMKKTSGVAIALDNCCALEIVNNEYRIIKSKVTAEAYKVYWNKGKFYEKIVPSVKFFQPIEKLVKRG